MVCSLAYVKNASTVTLESTDFAAGRILASTSGTGSDVWYYTRDHLGSTRLITGANGTVLERSDYYPYGLRMEGGTQATGNRWHFAGKEEQNQIPSLAWLDFGARMYDPFLGRWTTQDPLAEKYPALSPYSYCAGNPISFMDDSGADIVIAGKNNSALTIQTEVINLNLNVSHFGIDWGGHHTIVGQEYVSAALDIAGVFDQSGVSDAINASYLFFSGKYLDSALSAIATIPILGDIAKLPRFGKDVHLLRDAVSIADVSGKWTKSLRANMIRAYGEAPSGLHAHHILPQKYAKQFRDLGFDINNPKYGKWIDGHQHLSKAKEYNDAWELFFINNPSPSKEMVEEEAKRLMMHIYGQ